MSLPEHPETLSHNYATAILALCDITAAHHLKGETEEAHRIARVCLQLSETNEVRPLDRLKSYLQYARVLVEDYLLTNEHSEFMFSILQQAKELAESESELHSLADTLSLLGQGRYFEMLNKGQSLEASESLAIILGLQHKALKIREDIQDTRGISESRFYIGQIYERLQDLDQALEQHAASLKVAELHGHRYERTEPLRHLAVVSISNGDLDQALVYALQALSNREECGLKSYLPLDHRLVCDIYLKKGNVETAFHHAREAVSISEQLGSKGALASALLGVGDVCLARKEENEARVYYERSLALAQQLHHAMFTALANGRIKRLTMH
ncbi:tetratricopeptide repeat protein [Paenibacillus cellulosilyticus]|uniref:Tetratricopeptide repeat protein n=1 Tax=Paenibacillus cellulosilyticus TaxID=375489 RepID=A0A2V2YT04_9BACL|nr:tetratricopeptide repeat protein [Paenibacillus cellulosilyticus]PWW02447.1 tetratricopeptide repeat protein [Paenibacillus cellulosilyticus]QKS47156.1 tetratricopeptide repeat protein [Paenibacillus cellulosilyticus]